MGNITSGITVLAAGTAAVIGESAQPQESPSQATSEQAQHETIQGVDQYRVTEPLFEAVRIALNQHGDPHSANYIQGISGAAFRIAGICPCAPTSSAMSSRELVQLLGYEVEVIAAESSGVSYADMEKLGQAMSNNTPPTTGPAVDIYTRFRPTFDRMLQAIRSEIHQDRTVVAWHAFSVAENDVITGYDSTRSELLGRGSYQGNQGNYARAAQTRMLTSASIGGLPAIIIIGKQTKPFDAAAARAAELAALREAVRHAHDTTNLDKAGGEKWCMLQGIAAYNRWVTDFQKPDKKRGSGDAYCYGIYRTTHRAAGGFLTEIAGNYPQAREHLLQAAQEFTAEADTLDKAAPLLSWSSPERPDAQRNAKVANLLAAARDHYIAGITAIENALPLMQD